MSYKDQKLLKVGLMAVSVAVLALLIIGGCAGRKKQTETASKSMKHIVDIDVHEGFESVDVKVQGDKPLTYTPVKQTSPLGLILYFPQTSVVADQRSFSPQNDIIDMVNISQIDENGQTSRIEISLSNDVPYEVTREGSGLIVSFKKDDFQKNRAYGEEPSWEISHDSSVRSAAELPTPVSTNGTYPGMPPATRLETVYATELENSLKVFVGADGTITNYRSFTISNPPRIVFDIFHVSSPYKIEKTVPVNSNWVKKVRYFGYPDRLRLVLDTYPQYLSDFSAYPVNNGLLIHVGATDTYPGIVARASSPSQPYFDDSMPKASRLQSVYATQQANGTLVTIRGDGAITNYNSRVLNNPPRIVFDIYDLKSPYNKRDSFPVDTKWVKSVYHTSQPDKLQVVIETRSEFLSEFRAQPDKNGLVIQVGGVGAAPGSRIVTRSGDRQPGVDYSKTAWVDRIDFLSEDAGRSTLVIGTSRPIIYEVDKLNKGKLRIDLSNTKIPDYRKRPLITDSFESAVDRIEPKQKGNESVFEVNLREDVPYYVEQTDNLLMVHFEASSIPPKTYDEYGSSTYQQTVAQTTDQSSVASMPSAPSGVSDLGMAEQGVTQMDLDSAAPPGGPAPSISYGDFGDEASRKYTGEKIALDFYETDIKNVFRILKEVSQKNFAIDRDVTGKVTLALEQPVPWDQVLDLILKMNRLGRTYEGDIIRVATLETLKQEEEERRAKETAEQTLKEQQKALEPLFTEYIPINYSKADTDILPKLEKIKTPDRGTLSVDVRTNMIIMTDTAEKIRLAKEMVEKLDRVTPQVLIEAKVVEASASFVREIGNQWGASIGITNDSERAGVGPQRGYDMLGGTYGSSMAVNLPTTTSPAGLLGIDFLRVAGTPLMLSATLMAMETNNNGKIISSPRILTLNNKPAKIKQGYEYPYSTWDVNEGVGFMKTEFKDISLELEVTPQITPDNRIAMKVSIKKDDVYEQTNAGPALSKKEATTELLVNDGDTIVIGGIIKSNTSDRTSSVPGLSKIPLLGWLFKADQEEERKEELLIFITPRIVQLEQRHTYF